MKDEGCDRDIFNVNRDIYPNKITSSRGSVLKAIHYKPSFWFLSPTGTFNSKPVYSVATDVREVPVDIEQVEGYVSGTCPHCGATSGCMCPRSTKTIFVERKVLDEKHPAVTTRWLIERARGYAIINNDKRLADHLQVAIAMINQQMEE